MPRKAAAARRVSQDALDEAGRRRSQHAVIRRYLEALEWRGAGTTRRRVDPSTLQARVDALNDEIAQASPVTRVKLIQARMDVETELAGLETTEETESFELLEAEFVEHAAEWAERKGISYNALRETGVPARVLKDAGIARTMRPS